MSVRVLHVITRLTLGGSSENTIASCVALARAGYDCTLAASFRESEAPSLDDARRRGCRVVDVPSLGREVAPLADLAALGQILRLIRRERPSIIHTHTSKAGFVGRLAALIARVPAVIHQPHGHIFYGYYGPRRTAVFTALERQAARWTDRIVALTERGIAEHLAHGIGRPAQYVAVPSGVPTAALRAAAPLRAEARARLGLDAGAFVVVGLGRLIRIKGFDLLVRALPGVIAQIPSARLLLVGEGPERPSLDAIAASLGLTERLWMTGETADVPMHLVAADVVVVPSRNEGMGRVIVESMALGVPVVATTVGGIPDVVTDGECGRLVEPDDVDALAAALVELGRDPALRRKLGEAARARAEAFSTSVANEKLLALYAALVRDKRLA
ncbi:MAG TPA: glycosyltransferase family 4 protein [Candidatus Binatia bacterium]|nr:glycosyltransferase family 4 protein [Candidatus Binatia bacterium]